MTLACDLRTLAALLRQGRSTPEALALVGRRSPSTAWQACAQRMEQGSNLAQAMQAEAEFPRLLILGLSRAPEDRLPEALGQLARLLEERQLRLQSWRLVLAYPCLLAVGLVALLAGAMLLVRQYSPMLANLPLELPNSTRLILLASRLSTTAGALPLWLVPFACIWALLARPDARLALPVLGPGLRRQEARGFIAWLGYLVDAGQPLPQAVELAAEACCSGALRAQLLQASRLIEEGSSLRAATQVITLFPSLARWLLGQAEASQFPQGSLQQAALLLGRDEELQAADQFALAETALTVLIGAAVLLFMLALVFPAYELALWVGSA